MPLAMIQVEARVVQIGIGVVKRKVAVNDQTRLLSEPAEIITTNNSRPHNPTVATLPRRLVESNNDLPGIIIHPSL